MSKTAIIIGATGLTGGLLLECLLEDNRYKTIKLFSRSSCGIKHSKIEEHLVDIFELEKHEDVFDANDVFCCIGTTKAKTPNEEAYLKIDYGIPVAISKLCVKNNIDTLVVISALGANKNSTVFYNRTKGRMEEDVLKANIKNIYMLQPSLISGNRAENRFGEKIAKIFMTVLNPLLIGSFKKYRSIHPRTIVNTMIWLANNTYESGRIPSNRIQNISDRV
ncbi:Rossmann-fold NAD(P)-binding domain-containing protein [Yeosuana marina]|uniref:NAD-dependent epimerase/dehydratase family protein n=1 Tax=Yeosuana marina TaxID=1565536 RepID=UPI0014235A8B|nr:NAD-dependent epimerase/dehydratase family protein [Yeosuana marina]